ncbi:MAG: hypothetical protein AAGA10_21015 [Bacteroidota bacterium]
MYRVKFGYFLVGILLFSCKNKFVKELYVEEEISAPLYRPLPSPQLTDGDPEKGLEYLIYGDYMGTGFPFKTFDGFVRKQLGRYVGDDEGKVLSREGINSNVPFTHTAFKANTGAWVVNGNCFSCHAGRIEGKVVLGLGNSFSDYRRNFKFPLTAMNTFMRFRYPKDSPEWQAYAPTIPMYKALASNTKAPNYGMNPASRTAEIAGLYRNPADLSLVETPIDSYEIAPVNVVTDVPPLWHVKKKHSLYYNGLGHGDFTKLLMQITLAGIEDTTHARKVQENFVDVLAWINELEPPKYPKEINLALADQGKLVYNDNCSKCHGKYGERDTYPNKLVPLHEVQTDPAYARTTIRSDFVGWYNQSWYANSPPYSEIKPSEGYIAPPLDGIWATAPYLHNGSIPTLEDLLDSEKRPAFWQRSGSSKDLDYQRVGWQYERKGSGKGKYTYDTTENGSSNSGHYYGDKLTSDEREAIIEYLKTL